MVPVPKIEWNIMIYLLRIFFHSLGLAIVLCAFALNPATAQFSDMLAVLHTAFYWQLVAMVAITTWGADLVFSGDARKVTEMAFSSVSRLAGGGTGNFERYLWSCDDWIDQYRTPAHGTERS